MPNVSYQELAETKSQPLPADANLEALKQMRESQCSSSASRDFKLQSNQRFLRRVMSPDSPTRNLLMVHGTGVGKTCTAIQIAEEYIIRPEFQDKRVLILANPSIQENFKTQIFDISRVSVDPDGILLSKQCTGRRYLDIIERSQSESLRYTDKASQQRVMNLANKIISEFYEFVGYLTFANMIDRQKLVSKTENDLNKWIHETFDNRLIIIDEAHNLKETTESESNKLVAIAIEHILKTANGVTLVLLTATPMYDTFDELIYYFNLFLWNERKIEKNKMIKASDIFTESGDFKAGQEEKFRQLCQDYVSFVRGENPFTFPFRLPPPDNLIAKPDRTTDIRGNKIANQRKHLTLTRSFVSPMQAQAIQNITVKAVSDSRLICMYPENKTFRETFEKTEGSYKYRGEQFLAPSKVALYSSKFGLIMQTTASTNGIVFVYSNVVESGAQLFAMCLEEHGYEPLSGKKLLSNTSGEIARGSKGKYVLFTSDISDSEIKRALIQLKRPENADGSAVRFVIASPKVSEGVDFRNVRQIHVLDPWFNMSRIEQVLGRGMRTCSHSLLPFEQQNCTVYLHVCRYPDSEQETVDEYIYRTFVEEKAVKIAKVKRFVMESAMDCELQLSMNSLPAQWRGEPNESGERFLIPQTRNQDNLEVQLPLAAMAAPMFEEGPYEIQCKVQTPEIDPEHERPLSAILDVKDEILDKITKLFVNKPVWKSNDLFKHSAMKQYSKEVVSYILQNAIDTGFQLKDKNNRVGHLQAKDDVIAFTVGENDTLLDRLIVHDNGTDVKLPEHAAVEVEEEAPVAKVTANINLDAKRQAYAWPKNVVERFSPEVLDWYLVDNVLTDKEKTDLLLSLNWSTPPVYAKPLLATTPEGKKLYILGSKNIFNDAKEKITPVGVEQDTYRAWIKAAKDRFVEKKADLFATMKDGGIMFNMDEKASSVMRAMRAKTIGGRQCTTYQASLLDAFSEWLVGTGFPESVKTKKDRCLFLDLLVREAVISGKEGIFWVTPEEYSIFSEDEHRPDLLKRLQL
jgi:superfamily II DNA or RNA helicase